MSSDMEKKEKTDRVDAVERCFISLSNEHGNFESQKHLGNYLSELTKHAGDHYTHFGNGCCSKVSEYIVFSSVASSTGIGGSEGEYIQNMLRFSDYEAGLPSKLGSRNLDTDCLFEFLYASKTKTNLLIRDRDQDRPQWDDTVFVGGCSCFIQGVCSSSLLYDYSIESKIRTWELGECVHDDCADDPCMCRQTVPEILWTDSDERVVGCGVGAHVINMGPERSQNEPLSPGDGSSTQDERSSLIGVAADLSSEETDMHFSAANQMKTSLVMEEWKHYSCFTFDEYKRVQFETVRNQLSRVSSVITTTKTLPLFTRRNSMTKDYMENFPKYLENSDKTRNYIITLRFALSSYNEFLTLSDIFGCLDKSDLVRSSPLETPTFATGVRDDRREYLPRLISIDKIFPYDRCSGRFLRAAVVHLDFTNVTHIKYDSPAPEFLMPIVRGIDETAIPEKKTTSDKKTTDDLLCEEDIGDSEDEMDEDGTVDFGQIRLGDVCNTSFSMFGQDFSMAQRMSSVDAGKPFLLEVDEENVEDDHTEPISSAEFTNPPGLPPRILSFADIIEETCREWEERIEEKGRRGFRGTMTHDKPLYHVLSQECRKSPSWDQKRATLRDLLIFFRNQCRVWEMFIKKVWSSVEDIKDGEDRMGLLFGNEDTVDVFHNPGLYALVFFVSVGIFNSGCEVWNPVTRLFLKGMEEPLNEKREEKNVFAVNPNGGKKPMLLHNSLTVPSYVKLVSLSTIRQFEVKLSETFGQNERATITQNYLPQFPTFRGFGWIYKGKEVIIEATKRKRETLLEEYLDLIDHSERLDNAIKEMKEKRDGGMEWRRTATHIPQLEVEYERSDSISAFFLYYIKEVINAGNVVTNHQVLTLSHLIPLEFNRRDRSIISEKYSNMCLPRRLLTVSTNDTTDVHRKYAFMGFGYVFTIEDGSANKEEAYFNRNTITFPEILKYISIVSFSNQTSDPAIDIDPLAFFMISSNTRNTIPLPLHDVTENSIYNRNDIDHTNVLFSGKQYPTNPVVLIEAIRIKFQEKMGDLFGDKVREIFSAFIREENNVIAHHTGDYVDLAFLGILPHPDKFLPPPAAVHFINVKRALSPSISYRRPGIIQEHVQTLIIDPWITDAYTREIETFVQGGFCTFDLSNGLTRDDLWWNHCEIRSTHAFLVRELSSFEDHLRKCVQLDGVNMYKEDSIYEPLYSARPWHFTPQNVCGFVEPPNEASIGLRQPSYQKEQPSWRFRDVSRERTSLYERGTSKVTHAIRNTALSFNIFPSSLPFKNDDGAFYDKTDAIQWINNSHFSVYSSDLQNIMPPEACLFDVSKYRTSLAETISWSPENMMKFSRDMMTFVSLTGSPPFGGMISSPTLFERDEFRKSEYAMLHQVRIYELLRKSKDGDTLCNPPRFSGRMENDIINLPEGITVSYSKYMDILKKNDYECMINEFISKKIRLMVSGKKRRLCGKETSDFSVFEKMCDDLDTLRSLTTVWTPERDELPTGIIPGYAERIYYLTGFDIDSIIRLFGFSTNSLEEILKCFVDPSLIWGGQMRMVFDDPKLSCTLNVLTKMFQQEICFLEVFAERVYGTEFLTKIYANADFERVGIQHTSPIMVKQLKAQMIRRGEEELSIIDLPPFLLFVKISIDYRRERVCQLKEETEKENSRCPWTQERVKEVYTNYIGSLEKFWEGITTFLSSSHDYVHSSDRKGLDRNARLVVSCIESQTNYENRRDSEILRGERKRKRSIGRNLITSSITRHNHFSSAVDLYSSHTRFDHLMNAPMGVFLFENQTPSISEYGSYFSLSLKKKLMTIKVNTTNSSPVSQTDQMRGNQARLASMMIHRFLGRSSSRESQPIWQPMEAVVFFASGDSPSEPRMLGIRKGHISIEKKTPGISEIEQKSEEAKEVDGPVNDMLRFFRPITPSFMYDNVFETGSSIKFVCISLPKHPNMITHCLAFFYDMCTFIDILTKFAINNCYGREKEMRLSCPWLGYALGLGGDSPKVHNKTFWDRKEKSSSIRGDCNPFTFYNELNEESLTGGESRENCDDHDEGSKKATWSGTEYRKVTETVKHYLRRINFCVYKDHEGDIPEPNKRDDGDLYKESLCMYAPLVVSDVLVPSWSSGEGISRAVMTEFFRIYMDPRYGFTQACAGVHPGTKSESLGERFVMPQAVFCFHPDIQTLMTKTDLETYGVTPEQEDVSEEVDQDQEVEILGETHTVRLGEGHILNIDHQDIGIIVSSYKIKVEKTREQEEIYHNTAPRYLPSIIPQMIAKAVMMDLNITDRFHPYLFGFGDTLLGIKPKIKTISIQAKTEDPFVCMTGSKSTRVSREDLQKFHKMVSGNIITFESLTTNPLALLCDRYYFHAASKFVGEETPCTILPMTTRYAEKLSDFTNFFCKALFEDIPNAHKDIIDGKERIDAMADFQGLFLPAGYLDKKLFFEDKENGIPHSFVEFMHNSRDENLQNIGVVPMLYHVNYPRLSGDCEDWLTCDGEGCSRNGDGVGPNECCMTKRTKRLFILSDWYINWGLKFRELMINTFSEYDFEATADSYCLSHEIVSSLSPEKNPIRHVHDPLKHIHPGDRGVPSRYKKRVVDRILKILKIQVSSYYVRKRLGNSTVEESNLCKSIVRLPKLCQRTLLNGYKDMPNETSAEKSFNHFLKTRGAYNGKSSSRLVEEFIFDEWKNCPKKEFKILQKTSGLEYDGTFISSPHPSVWEIPPVWFLKTLFGDLHGYFIFWIYEWIFHAATIRQLENLLEKVTLSKVVFGIPDISIILEETDTIDDDPRQMYLPITYNILTCVRKVAFTFCDPGFEKRKLTEEEKKSFMKDSVYGILDSISGDKTNASLHQFNSN